MFQFKTPCDDQKDSVLTVRLIDRPLLSIVLATSLSLFCCCDCNHLSAQDLTAHQAVQDDLVLALKQLKSGDYETRVNAIEVLKSKPEASLNVLNEVEVSFDVEWNLQIDRLKVVLGKQLNDQKLERFFAETNVSESDYWRGELPLWSLFEDQLGSQVQVRKLYADAVTEHLELFVQIQNEEIDLEDAVSVILGFENDRAEVSSGSIAAVLLLALQGQMWGKEGMPDRFMAEMESRLAAQYRLFKVGRFASLNRKLLTAWCEYRPMERAKFGSFHSFLNLALVCHIQEAFPKLMMIAEAEDMSVYARGTAMIYAISLARPADVEKFIPLLEDRTIVATPKPDPTTNSKFTCMICDFALFGLAIHQGIDVKQLGFTDLEVNDLLKVDRNRIGFSSKQEREAAIAYWKSLQPQLRQNLDLRRKSP